MELWENQEGNSPTQERNVDVADKEAQSAVVASLRGQIDDLYMQVSQLNNKLVQSYERVSDLEDDLHVASSNIRSSSVKISQLELERTQHLSALNTGLLVEKSHVTAELTRLMEKATEEAAQRGQAESARADIEKDLDDLSASLFGQANTMVAEARYARALSERKVEEAEQALKGAEEAVGIMQFQLQALHAEKETAVKKSLEMESVMGKGKWVERRASSTGPDIVRSIRLLSSHVPYQEFLGFIGHLRSVHNSSLGPIPAMSTLLPLPFLTRLLAEDSDPTVRLDLAPSLNWLSRRSVLAAIQNGQLIIEPMSSVTLLQESASHSAVNAIPGLNSSSNNISCALCGTPIFSLPDSTSHPHSRPPTHPLAGLSLPRSYSSTAVTSSWSNSLFKRQLSNASNTHSRSNSPPTTPTHQSSLFGPNDHPIPHQVHIFRVYTSQTASQPLAAPTSAPPTVSTSSFAASAQQPPHHPATHVQVTQQKQSTIYPLCSNGWCLTRLRATCTLWAFVRTGIVEKIWEEQLISQHATNGAPNLPPRSNARNSAVHHAAADKPPAPPRKRGLWGMASALGERASSWTESDKDRKDKAAEKEKPLPAPTPSVPSHAALAANVVAAPSPPPLPKRSEGRGRTLHEPPTTNTDVEAESRPTPTSEPAPSTDRNSVIFSVPHDHSLAHTIPLPDSPPPTPTQLVASESPVATVVAAAPPPLPRRAAARAQRSIPSDVSSRPASPAPVSKEDPIKTTPIAETTPEKQQENKPSTEATPAVGVDAPQSSAEKPILTNGQVVDEPSSVNNAAQTEDKNDVAKTIHADVDVDVDADTEQPIDLTEFLHEPKEPKNEPPESEEDKEVYISDATWEERTWKDVVKLKEDMFWARLGGLR